MLLQNIRPRAPAKRPRRVRNGQESTGRTTSEPLAELKVAGVEKDAAEFERTVKDIKTLIRDLEDAYRTTVAKLVKLAVAYNKAYLMYEKDVEDVKRLNKALGVTDAMATRWRKLAEAAPFLKRKQQFLPAGPEPLYEVVRAWKKDPQAVENAIDDKRLTPETSLEECRKLRRAATGTTHSADDERKARWTALSVHTMKHPQFRLTFTQDCVLRVEELSAFREKVEQVLRETLENVSLIELGASEGGKWLSGWELEERFKIYWETMDKTHDREKADAQPDTNIGRGEVAADGESD